MIGYIGEFEELVLLTIAALDEAAYGIGSLHSTITRLEEKGFIKSWLGDPTQERGGRRKRYFQLTDQGKAALRKVKALRDELWDLSKVNLAFSA
jgi:PadR family transcriptional regulator PadR